MDVTQTTAPTASMPSRTRRSCTKPTSALIVGLIGLCSASAMAQTDSATESESEFEFGATLGASWTDNVFLSAPGDEIEDVFYQISPFLRWSKQSQRLDGFLNYRYDRFIYDTADFNDRSFHFMDASLTGKALDETLQLQIGGGRRQVLENPETDVLPPRDAVSNNLTDLQQWFVAPSFIRTFGNTVTLDMRYRYTDSEFEEGARESDQTQDGQFRLDNYAVGQGLTWALNYRYIRSDYEVSIPFEFQTYSAELGYWLGSRFRVFGVGGRESQWDDLIDRSPQASFWEAGFAYRAGDRLSAEFAAGERSFGDSLRGSLDFQFRRGNTRLMYVQQPTTQGFNRRRGIPPLDPENPDDFLTNPGQAERFIVKRFDWSLLLEGRRTSATFLVFDEIREGRTAADGSELPDQKQRGVTVRFAWRAGTRTELVLNGTAVRREIREGAEDELFRITGIVNYTLGSRTTLTLQHRYVNQEPRESGTSRIFTANTTSLLITFAI